MTDPVKILVLALCRSGHHPVIHWLASQGDGNAVHHNCCNERLKPGESVRYGAGSGELEIYSLENFDLRGFQKHFYPEHFHYILMVMRDPRNWAASSIKADRGDRSILRPFTTRSELGLCKYYGGTMSRVDMYHQYMAQLLGENDLVGREVIGVSFNRWFASKDYRRALAGRLGLAFTDAGRNFVPKFGGGSSFEGRRKQNKGSSMKVLSRWRKMVGTQPYERVVRDPRMRRYLKEYFQ